MRGRLHYAEQSPLFAWVCVFALGADEDNKIAWLLNTSGPIGSANPQTFVRYMVIDYPAG